MNNNHNNKVQWNIIANATGRLWGAVLGILLVPVYVRFLGVEAYGLVGFSTSLQTIFALLDLGLGMTINRELARLSTIAGSEQQQRDLVRTLEIIYWGIAIVSGLIVISSAPLLARYWIQPEKLSIADVQVALMLVGVMIVFQFPYALYQGALTGLQKQVPLNIILVAAGSFRSIGVVLALLLIAPTIQVFFGWQVLSSLVMTASLALYLWYQLPVSGVRARFSKPTVSRIAQFALGMSGISITGILLYSADKVILSNRLTLEAFGFYSLAWTVASMISLVVSPINMAIFPRLSQLAATNERARLSTTYHIASQLTAVGIMPIVAVTVLFAPEILHGWTGDPAIVAGVAPLLTLLIVANGMNGLVNMPYSLQLAVGWTSLMLYANIIGLLVVVPLLYILAGPLGGIAGALCWLLVNLGYFLINVNIMHRRLLVGEAAQWYFQDLGLPLVGAFVTASLMRAWYRGAGRAEDIGIVVLTGFVALISAALMSPLLRRQALARIRLRIRGTQTIA